jgi:integrase
VGEARIAVSGPRCACRFKGMGPAPFEAPAPGRRPHRRQPRKRGRGFETAEQAEERGRFDLALVVVLSDAGLRRSEAAALTWGDVQRWDDGSGRITVIRSKTDVEAQGRRGGHHARRHEGLWTPSGRRALVAR